MNAVVVRRHDLLRVQPAAWETMLDRHPGLRDLPLVADWGRQGWPVIARRRMPGDRPGDVPAALPLPPDHGKRRVAFSFQSDASPLPAAPVSLCETARTAPEAWQATIAGLVKLGETVGSVPRVYGSLLWQHVTGLSYLTTGSDLDLLWPGLEQVRFELLVGGLRQLENDSPIRLDGEVELPDGAALNWREFADGRDGRTVLLKTMNGVEARSVTRLFEGAAS